LRRISINFIASNCGTGVLPNAVNLRVKQLILSVLQINFHAFYSLPYTKIKGVTIGFLKKRKDRQFCSD
jgi:hypothetical protein